MSLPKKNERCPCGSGKKFKKCCGRHKSIDTEKATPNQLSTIHFLVNQGSVDAAIEFIKKEEGGASSIELKLYKTFLYLKKNDFTAASILAKSIPKINTNLDILTKVFARLTNLRRFDLVKDFYQQLQTSVNNSSNTALYIQSLIELGEYENAAIILEPFVRELGPGADKYGLCDLAHKAGNYELAIKCFEQALSQEGGNSYAMKVSLALALHKLGDHHKALIILDEINVRHENLIDAIVLKINILLATSDLAVARSQIESLELDNKSNKELLQLKWKVLSASGSGDQLLSFAKEIFAIRPNEDWAVSQYIKTLHELGLKEEKIKTQESQLATGYSKSAGSLSGYAMTLLYSASTSEQVVYQAHVEAAGAITKKIYVPKNTKNKKIRIGYVSSDFKRHSVFYFIYPVIKAHDRSTFEIYAYYNGRIFDANTEDIKTKVDVWRPISFLDTDSAIQVIQGDQIDILIDLNGHTKGHRLDVFANDVCNVQATWVGYPATTGLKSIHYRFTDKFIDDIPKVQRFFTEKLIALSTENFSVYEPPKDMPDVSPLPSGRSKALTFGSLNNFSKITDEVLALWASLLSEVSDARVIIKNKAMRFPEVRQRVIAFFEEQGVMADRIDLIDRDASQSDHFSRYAQIDIALDTFPYSGTTTTCECLWMGIPVITLVGDSHRARVSAGILNTVGLSDFYATDKEGYINIAKRYNNDRDQLAGLRKGMRDRLSNSPLMAYESFTRSFEATLIRLHKEACH